MRRVKDDVVADNAATIAAGGALFGFLARLPTLALRRPNVRHVRVARRPDSCK